MTQIYDESTGNNGVQATPPTQRELPHNRVVHRLAALPRWLVTLLIVLFLSAPFLLAFVEGSLSAMVSSGIWRTIIVSPLIIVYILILMPVFERLENRVVYSLRSLVQSGDTEIDRLLVATVIVKQGHELLSFAAGLLVGLVLIQPWRSDGLTWLDIYGIITGLFMFGLLGLVIYGSIGTTRVTGLLLSQPLDVNLFDLRPFEPVGRLSLALSLAFLGGALGSALLVVSLAGFWTLPNLIVYMLFAIVVFVVFFANMWPTHGVLSAVKRADLDNAEANIDRAYREMRRLAAAGEDAQEAAVELNAWIAVERRLRATRTWPYNTEMLRTLFFSIMIPLLLALSRLAAAYIERSDGLW